jgi:hypothetical protein
MYCFLKIWICLCKSQSLDLPTARATGNVEIMKPVKKEKAVDSVFAESLYFASGAFGRAIGRLATACWKNSELTPSQGILVLHRTE